MVSSRIKNIGEMVRAARKEQGLTQGQLAAVTGVGMRFIRELEQGKASCQIGKALEVLAMLGLTIEVDGKPL